MISGNLVAIFRSLGKSSASLVFLGFKSVHKILRVAGHLNESY